MHIISVKKLEKTYEWVSCFNLLYLTESLIQLERSEDSQTLPVFQHATDVSVSQHATNSLIVCSPDSNAASEDKCDNMPKVLHDIFPGNQFSAVFSCY